VWRGVDEVSDDIKEIKQTEVEIQLREEGFKVPEGVSCTETHVAYYLRVREGNKFVRIRVTKNTLTCETELVDFS
jgi:hypothetical protein